MLSNHNSKNTKSQFKVGPLILSLVLPVLLIMNNVKRIDNKYMNYFIPQNWAMFTPYIANEKSNLFFKCTNLEIFEVKEQINLIKNLSNDILVYRTLVDNTRLLSKSSNNTKKEEAKEKTVQLLESICKSHHQRLEYYEIR